MSSTENNYVNTDLGNVALNSCGEYNADSSYEYLDTVNYEGGSYFCKVEFPKKISGIAPKAGVSTEFWQLLTIPGDATSEYIKLHDEVVNKAKQVETSRTAVELSQQEVEAAQADVSQMRQDTQEASEEAAVSRDSAAGYAQSAETSRTAAKESEDNINAQVTGFNTHVAEKTSAAESAIIEARQTAVNAVSAKQGDAVQTVTGEGNKQVKNVGDAGTEQVGKVKSAGASAVSAAGAAGVSAVNAVKTQQTASIKAVADEGTQQVTAVNTAGSTQASTIETKGANQVKAIKEAGENALQNISNGVDKGLSEEGKAADAKATGEAISKLTEDLDDLPFQLIKSKNEFNLESGDNQNKKSLSNVGAIIDDSNYSVSHKIKCKYGDTVYLSRKISDISDERQFVTAWNICAYDSSGKFLGISTKGSYAVPQNTDYVRFNYWTTLATTRKIMLSLNSDITYEEYFVPYRVIEKSAIDNPVKELFKDAGIIVARKIVMPMYGLYVMQGTSVPVFFDNIIMHGQAKNLNVFQAAKGNFVDNGIFQKSLETLEKGFYQNYIIVNSSYNTLFKKNDDVVNNSRLTVVDTNSGKGVTRKVLVIGDSITAANVWTDKLVDLFSDDVMNIEMLGTRGTSKAPNEGRGGWRAWNYAFEKDASNDGLSSSVTNPFLNPTSNNFDFSYYMTKQNYTSVDYVLLCLGTNDVSRNTHNTDDDILLAWKTIIDSIKSFDNNIKILIWLLPMPCGLTNEQPKKDMFLHMKELLINKYDNMASRQTNKIYLVDVGCSVSPTDDFNYKEELVSEYGDEKWKRPTDIIHPANKGYYAIAKNIHAGIKAIESGVITN